MIDESRERVKGVQIKHVPHTKTKVAQQKEIVIDTVRLS